MAQWLRKNGFNVLMVGLIALLWLVPSSKAYLIRGLMRLGFFRPKIETVEAGSRAVVPADDVLFEREDGKKVRLSELRGKVVFLNFWATWCPPCIAEMPGINDLYQDLNKLPDLVFILVDADGDLTKSRRFLTTHQYHLPLYQLNSEIPATLFSGTLPTTVVINKQGQIVFRETGAAAYHSEDFVNQLRQLATQP